MYVISLQFWQTKIGVETRSAHKLSCIKLYLEGGQGSERVGHTDVQSFTLNKTQAIVQGMKGLLQNGLLHKAKKKIYLTNNNNSEQQTPKQCIKLKHAWVGL